MKRHIAIIEDETELRNNYREAFERQGYQVSTFADRTTALSSLEQKLPDLAIIDVRLGTDHEGGFEICRQLRQWSKTLPIIFLSALDSDLDIISGLRLGADDYLTKDMSLPHLQARIVALFRRLDALHESNFQETIIERGELTLDPNRLTVLWKGSYKIDSSLTEFWILHALAMRPGHVKNRQQLMDAANIVVDEHTVTAHIKRLRKKFLLADPEFDAIETLYGTGYRWRVDPLDS